MYSIDEIFLKISQWLLLIEMYLFILILSATTIRRQLTRTRENMVYMSLTKSLNHDTLSLTGTQSLGLVSSQDQKSQSLLGKLAAIIEVDVSCLGVSINMNIYPMYLRTIISCIKRTNTYIQPCVLRKQKLS